MLSNRERIKSRPVLYRGRLGRFPEASFARKVDAGLFSQGKQCWAVLARLIGFWICSPAVIAKKGYWTALRPRGCRCGPYRHANYEEAALLYSSGSTVPSSIVAEDLFRGICQMVCLANHRLGPWDLGLYAFLYLSIIAW
jgi:hypothetical protein